MRRYFFLWLPFWLSALCVLRSWDVPRDRFGTHVSYCRHCECPRPQSALLLTRLPWWAPVPHGLTRACRSGGMALRATAYRSFSSPVSSSAVTAVMSWIKVPLSLPLNRASGHRSAGGIFGDGFMQLRSMVPCLWWVYAGLDSIFGVAILVQMMWGFYPGCILLWLCLPLLVLLWHYLLRDIGPCRKVPSTLPLMRPRKSKTVWLKGLLLFLWGSEVICQLDGGRATRQDNFVLPASSPFVACGPLFSLQSKCLWFVVIIMAGFVGSFLRGRCKWPHQATQTEWPVGYARCGVCRRPVGRGPELIDLPCGNVVHNLCLEKHVLACKVCTEELEAPQHPEPADVDPVCEVCLTYARVPYRFCSFCGAKPSYHHGRCCWSNPDWRLLPTRIRYMHLGTPCNTFSRAKSAVEEPASFKGLTESRARRGTGGRNSKKNDKKGGE